MRMEQSDKRLHAKQSFSSKVDFRLVPELNPPVSDRFIEAYLRQLGLRDGRPQISKYAVERSLLDRLGQWRQHLKRVELSELEDGSDHRDTALTHQLKNARI